MSRTPWNYSPLPRKKYLMTIFIPFLASTIILSLIVFATYDERMKEEEKTELNISAFNRFKFEWDNNSFKKPIK